MQTVFLIIDCLGVAAYSISGTLVGIRKQTDCVGALIFALLASFGGGLIRDLILGITPPHLFWHPDYAIYLQVAVPVSLIWFHLAFFPRAASLLERHKDDFLLSFFDTIGLASFCVSGINVAIQNGYSSNYALMIFCGCITGVGGGILRDVVASRLPIIFRKDVYLLPTIAGAMLYVSTYRTIPRLFSTLLSMSFIIIMRLLAILLHWNFPTHKES